MILRGDLCRTLTPKFLAPVSQSATATATAQHHLIANADHRYPARITPGHIKEIEMQEFKVGDRVRLDGVVVKSRGLEIYGQFIGPIQMQEVEND